MSTNNVFLDYLESAILNAVFRNTTYTSPATVYAALYTTAPAEAGTGGTEVSGGSYARTAVTFGAPADGSGSPAPKEISNSGAVTFPQATGSWGTVTHVGICDASTSGNILTVIPLDTSQAVASGNTFSIAVGALVIGLN